MSGSLVFWVCLGFSAAGGQRSFRFVVSDFYVKPVGENLFENLSWTLQNHSTISLTWVLNRDIVQVDIETSLDILKPNKQIMRIYKIRMDGCKFLTTVHKNRIFNILIRIFEEGSKGELKCPLKAHHNYTINNMHLAETELPQYVPECQFRTLTKFILKQRVVALLVTEGKVEYLK